MKELNLVYKGGKFNLEYLNFILFFLILISVTTASAANYFCFSLSKSPR
jgi:hypothetical protein